MFVEGRVSGSSAEHLHRDLLLRTFCFRFERVLPFFSVFELSASRLPVPVPVQGRKPPLSFSLAMIYPSISYSVAPVGRGGSNADTA